MANQFSFSTLPTANISRSRFDRDSQHKTSFNLGDIIPIYCDADILPGDTISVDVASLVRMSTPIRDIMDNIYLDYYSFFVPNRILWKDWKKFMGESDTSGYVQTPPVMPTIDLATGPVSSHSVGDYLGLPVGYSGSVSSLPGRAYLAIYNRWFRDQNIIAPFNIDLTSTHKADYLDVGSSFNYGSKPLKAAKFSDYFTRALPYAQKGPAVTLPLGTTAPIGVNNTIPGTATIVNGVYSGSSNNDFTYINGTNGSKSYPLFADLSSATAATINDLRFAFACQKLLEKDALYGSRYWEVINAHFGVKAPDASLQDPEFIAHGRMRINIDQVLQTTGYSDEAAQSSLGAVGANSVTAKKLNLSTYSAVEHGVFMIVAVARHDQTYGQGLNRMWSRRERFDYYWPVFANLGAQEIKNKEIYAKDDNNDDKVFGFQEAWAEYRYRPSQVSGLLNPAANNSLSFWTLANKFDALPTLGQSFIEQDRNNISRALVTGSNGPDFIADFYFNSTYVRPMPTYSIPGLIDHH